MQRRILLGAGAALLAVAAFVAVRSVTNHQAGRALDEQLDQLLARLPPGYAVRHGATEVNPLTNSLTVHDVVVTHDRETLGTADQVVVSGADSQALRDVFDPAAYPDGRPAWTDRRLLIADASARNVRLGSDTAAPGGATIGELSLHRLSGRPFMLPPTRANSKRPEFLADAALDFSADQAAERNFAMHFDTSSTGQLGASALSFNNYDGGKLGSVEMKGCLFSASSFRDKHTLPFRMTIGELGVTGLNARALLETIRRTGQVDRPQLGQMTYESGAVHSADFDVIDGPHIGFDHLDVTQTFDDAGSSGRGSLHGFTLALGRMTVPAAASPALAAFGMTALTMDIDATTQATKAGGLTALHEDVVMRDLGKLHIDAGVSDTNTALVIPGKPLAALLSMTLDHATLAYEDASLVGRLLAVAAVQAHTTPEAVRARLAMPLAALGVMLPDQPDAAAQVTAFLDHPGTLTVTMTPPQKITLAEVAQAPVTSRAHLLGVHVTAR